tara:strand:+ start:863 stop:1663 length:801 start_codon:yes stop_codon:yes gene_type:complete
MADLQNAQIDQSYPCLIKTFDNGPIDGTFKFLSDGAGNTIPIEVSNADVRILSNQIQLTDTAAVNGFAITAASAAFGGTVDFSAATVNGLPAGATGLESGTGTSSMQSAASLTATAAIASGSNSIALGDSAQALSASGIAIGNNSNAWFTAVAIGSSARCVNSQEAIAIGQAATCTTTRAIAIGSQSDATATSAIALGYFAQATATGAVALGTAVTAATDNTTTVNLLQIAGYAGMNYPDDPTAAIGGIPLGGVYHTDGALKIRIT